MGEKVDDVVNRFFKNTPQIRTVVDDASELSDIRSQLTELVSKLLSNKVDGEKTKTKGICDCGYKHWLNQLEYDFVQPVMVEGLFLGWNWGDDIFAVTERFVEEHKAPHLRSAVLDLILLKESNALRKQMVMAEVAKENTVVGNVVCDGCKASNPYGRFSAMVKCVKCSQEVKTPLFYEASGFRCMYCEATCGYFPTQKYRFCVACENALLVCKCQKCGSDLGCPAKELRSKAECPRCHTYVETGWPKHLLREQDPALRLVPVSKLVLYSDKAQLRRILEALTSSNAVVGEAAAMDDMEQVHLQQLAGLIEQGGDCDFGEFSTVVTKKLLDWPAAHNFAALDLLRVMLLNPSYAAVALKKGVLERVLEAGWKAGSDWRCRFNALKCICNLMPVLLKSPLTILDSLLGAIEVTFAATGVIRDHELVAASQMVLNLAIALAQVDDATLAKKVLGGRQQVLTCLATSFLPRAVEERKRTLSEAASSRSVLSGELPKEVATALQKADEVMTLLLQAYLTIQISCDPGANTELLKTLNAEHLLKLLLEVDSMIPLAYLGVKPHNSTTKVRSLLREVIWSRLA